MKRLVFAATIVAIIACWAASPVFGQTPSATTCGNPQQTSYVYNNHFYICTNGVPYQVDGSGGGGGATLPFPGIVYATSASGGTVATSPQLVTALNTSPSTTLATALIPALSYAATNASTTVNGQPCALSSTCTVTSNTPNAVTFAASGGASPGTTFNGASPVTVSPTTIGVGANGILGDARFNILDYKGAADATVSTITTALASGSATLVDSTAPFTSANLLDPSGNPKLFVVNCAGPGSNGCVPYSQGINITSSSSASSTTQITFTANAINTQTLASGNQLLILTAGTTGGIASLTSTIPYYACSVTGSTALLYTSPSCTGNVTFTSTGTGQMFFGDVELVTTCSYVSATTCTLAASAGTLAAIGTSYTWGTNNAAPFASAQTAAAAVTPWASGTIYFPHGKYLASGTAGSPNTIVVAANFALPISHSNITVTGDGPGVTTLLGGTWYGPVIGAYTNSTNLTNIYLRNMSTTYAYAPGVRFSIDYSSLNATFDAPSGGTITNCGFDNMEAFNDIGSFNFINNVSNCRGNALNSHDGHSNGLNIMAQGSGNTVSHVSFTNSFVSNRGDSGLATDCISGSTCGDISYDNIQVYNVNDAGEEIIGANNGITMTNNVFRKTFGPCVKIGAETGYNGNVDVHVSHSRLYGCGTGTTQYGNSVVPKVAGVLIEAPGSGGVSGVAIDDVLFDADGANKTVGSYVGIVASPASTIKDVSLTNIQGLGGINGTPSTGQTLVTGVAGLDFEAGTNITVGVATVVGSYNDCVYFAPAMISEEVTSPTVCKLGNTNSTGSHYPLDIQGGFINYVPPFVSSPVNNWAAYINNIALPAATNTSTFSTAGGFTSGSLSGQSGTGTGPLAWTIASTGNASVVTVSTSLNTISCVGTCSSAVPGNAWVNSGRRDVCASATVSVVPATFATAASILFGYDGTNNPIQVNLFNLEVTQAGVVVSGLPTYTTTTGDVVNACLQGNRVTVSYTRSGTTKFTTDVPNVSSSGQTQGTFTGLSFAGTVNTISAFSVSAP